MTALSSTSLSRPRSHRNGNPSRRKRVWPQVSGATLLMLSCCVASAVRPGDPVISLPLEPFGFQALPPRFMADGASMMTLHFVDSNHLLFTFHARSLLPRLPDATPEDDDRNVQAVLLELPSGRVLARTEWRTRDREQYLWPLQHGRFLLRIRTRLSVIDPLKNLPGGEAFRQQEFLDMKRRLGYVSVSPGGDLLTIETVPERKPKVRLTGAAASAAALAATEPGAKKELDTPRPRPEVQIHFFRLSSESESESQSEPVAGKTSNPNAHEHLLAHSAGVVRAPTLINVPATGEGFLDIAKESPGVYLFDFQPHAGKRIELSPYDTTCMPRPYFVSKSEFIAFGCRGGADKQELSGFNLRGEEPWLQVFSNAYVSPYLVAAPAAGRFALSRVLISGSHVEAENLVPEEMTGQEVMVIQSHDGRVLLKVSAAPVQRAGQNLDLSDDGLSLAVIRDGKIEIYHLPSLSAKDQKAVSLATASIPAKSNALVKLNAVPVAPAEQLAQNPSASSTPTPTAPPPKPLAPAAPAPVQAIEAPRSAEEPAQPRKPPTLYDAEHPNTNQAKTPEH